MAVGGNVRPPIKLVDVKPLYPVHLAHQGIEGTVVLKGLIGTDGRVHDLEVVAAPQAELGQAALDAVWQWEFDATLLNCTPVAIALKTNVNFRLTDR